jgi:hypothetical protein
MKGDLMQLAQHVCEASGGRVRLAFNEDDATDEKVADAAHFLKLDGRRIGRDVELYALMASVGGKQVMLADFLEGVVLPLQVVPESYRVALEAMRRLGRSVFAGKHGHEWNLLLQGLSLDAQALRVPNEGAV